MCRSTSTFTEPYTLNDVPHWPCPLAAQIRENVVADAPGDYDLVVPQRGIWGTAGVGGWNIDKCAAQNPRSQCSAK